MADWVFHIVTAIASAASVYGAIRADLARLHERATHASATAEKAHQRIDDFLNRGPGHITRR